MANIRASRRCASCAHYRAGSYRSRAGYCELTKVRVISMMVACPLFAWDQYDARSSNAQEVQDVSGISGNA